MGASAFGNAQKTRLPGGSPRPHPRPSRYATALTSKTHIFGLGILQMEARSRRYAICWTVAACRAGAGRRPSPEPCLLRVAED